MSPHVILKTADFSVSVGATYSSSAHLRSLKHLTPVTRWWSIFSSSVPVGSRMRQRLSLMVGPSRTTRRRTRT
eukprot:4225267-Prymnesium_polylepis.1